MTGPLLCGGDQFPPDPFPPVLGLYEPTFQITDVVRFTVFHKGPDAGFKETDQPSGTVVGNDHELRFGMVNDLEHLTAVILIIVLVPQQSAKAEPLIQVIFAKGPDGVIGSTHYR